MRARQPQETEGPRQVGTGKARITVMDGACSRAVGVSEVLAALQEAAQRPGAEIEVLLAGCDGACFLAPRAVIDLPPGQRIEHAWLTPERARCLAANPGAAPAAAPGVEGFWSLQQRRALAGCGRGDPTSIADYLARGGYAGLASALRMGPEQVIEAALRADLRGKGGAYFPAARKWQSARAAPGQPRYLVANAEEGEPGVYKDRHLMEGDPHLLLEGLAIAAYACGASHGYIYVNAEAGLAAQRIERAVGQARERGFLGHDILGSGFSLDAEVRRGAGGYVCGEETTLLNTIEGYRRAPRVRPPFPTEAGLWGMPTVVNNVETLCSVAVLFSRRPEEPAQPDTKLLCLSGAVRRPGLVEVPFGTTLRQVVYGIGGGAPAGRRVVGVVAGGPSGGLLPERALDAAIRPGAFHPSGAVLGSGGIVVLDDSTPVVEVVRRLAAYNAAESCGKCTPCREGTPRIVEALDRLLGGRGRPEDLDELRGLAEIVSAASLCGLGQLAGGPIASGLHFFGDEFARLAGVSRQSR